MSPEYVEIVREHVDAFNRADVEALMAICSDDVLFLPGRSALQGGYRGEEGLRSFFADNADTFEVITVRLDEFHDAGDRVVATGQVRIRPLGGGPDTDTRWRSSTPSTGGRSYGLKTCATAQQPSRPWG